LMNESVNQPTAYSPVFGFIVGKHLVAPER
jgi:hypothetical protein